MRTLTKGNKETQGWSKKLICTGKGNGNDGCHALLLVEFDDLFYDTLKYRRNGDETETFISTFRCHDCGALTDLAKNEEPKEFPRPIPYIKDWFQKNEIYHAKWNP